MRISIGAVCSFSLCFSLLGLLGPRVYASSSGLNNIPTADTPGDREIVLQAYTNQRANENENDDYFVGFKIGLRPWGQRLEFGLDLRIGEEDGPVVLQAKYAIQPWKNLPTLAIGVANQVLDQADQDRTGEAFKFVVLTHDLTLLRVHAGYGWQNNGNAAFFGLDKTFQLLERDLMLRADMIQIDDEQQWLGSLGFLYMLHEHVALESWVSQPLDDGDPIFTMKLNLIWKL